MRWGWMLRAQTSGSVATLSRKYGGMVKRPYLGFAGVRLPEEVEIAWTQGVMIGAVRRRGDLIPGIWGYGPATLSRICGGSVAAAGHRDVGPAIVEQTFASCQ
jgi:hypothetical protein